MVSQRRIKAEVPAEEHHRDLIACQRACPVHTDARGYVRAIAEGRLADAYLIARGPNPFASICGRICGAPCEAACRRGKIPRVDSDGRFVGSDLPVAIRALKRVACERYGAEARAPVAVLEDLRAAAPTASADAEEMAALLTASVRGRFVPANGERIAIVGAGPAGLAAAHDLALLGLKPVVFEREPVAAGMLAVGVPSYRLPRELIRREVAVIEALGAELRTGIVVGEGLRFADLRHDYAAVIVAVGAKRSRALGLPGEGGPRVYGGVDMLRAIALGEPIDLGHDVVVIGGGNVAYDVARTVVRQSAIDAARAAARLPGIRRVRLVSLETLEEMPADTVEIREGDEEGVERLNGWGPVEIERDPNGAVSGVVLRRCVRVYDEAHRFAPEWDDRERQTLPCDTVLVAAGQVPDLSFLAEGGDDVQEIRPGWPQVDPETLATTAPGVFVAGDLAHGTRLLIDAVASGKRAARSVYRHVTGRSLQPETTTMHLELPGYRREPGYEAIRRAELPAAEPADRLHDAHVQVERVLDLEAAQREARRCLDCGVTPVFDGTRCVLCGGCAEVCPTLCLKLMPLEDVDFAPLADASWPSSCDEIPLTVILKDEDRCIRCALCAQRCPTEAIAMERFCAVTTWSST